MPIPNKHISNKSHTYTLAVSFQMDQLASVEGLIAYYYNGILPAFQPE